MGLPNFYDLHRDEILYELRIRGLSCEGDAHTRRQRMVDNRERPVDSSCVGNLSTLEEVEECGRLLMELDDIFQDLDDETSTRDAKRLYSRICHLVLRLERLLPNRGPEYEKCATMYNDAVSLQQKISFRLEPMRQVRRPTAPETVLQPSVRIPQQPPDPHRNVRVMQGATLEDDPEMLGEHPHNSDTLAFEEKIATLGLAMAEARQEIHRTREDMSGVREFLDRYEAANVIIPEAHQSNPDHNSGLSGDMLRPQDSPEMVSRQEFQDLREELRGLQEVIVQQARQNFMPPSNQVPHLQAIQQQLAQLAVEPRSRALTNKEKQNLLDRVRKWGLRFDGSPAKAIAFVERLGELKEEYELPDETLFRAIPEVLTGDALLWYRMPRDPWCSWEDFLQEFRAMYFPPNYEERLEEEARNRTQGPNERVQDYVIAISTILRRLGTYSEEKKLKLIYRNLRPDYRLYVKPHEVTSITALIAQATSYELVLRQMMGYKPPPNPAQASFPDTAYDSRKPNIEKVLIPQTLALTAPPKPATTTQRQPIVQLAGISQEDQPKSNRQENSNFSRPTTTSTRNPSCWNCNGADHRFSECPQPRSHFCYRCGEKGVTVKSCPRCRNKGSHPTPTASIISEIPPDDQTQDQDTSSHSGTAVGSIFNRDARWYLPIKVQDTEVMGLIDTGASRSYISSQTWRRLSKLGCTLQAPRRTHVTLANGYQVELQGETEITTRVGSVDIKLEFSILPELHVPMILGKDSLTALRMQIDAGNETYHIGSEDSNIWRKFVTFKPTAGLDVPSLAFLSDVQRTTAHDFIEEEMKKFHSVKGRTDLAEHKIEVTTQEPIRQWNYRMSPVLQEATITETKEMLQKDVVEKSNSPWNNPIAMVKKDDGTWRFCLDFRKLNSVTRKDAYPLPRMEDILDRLSHAKYFSKIDLKHAYWQIPLAPDSKQYTAYSIPGFGHFQFKVMPYGLCNSGATFQRLGDFLIGPELEPYAYIYLDDIIIISEDFETHIRVLRQILQILRDANLMVNFEKCRFFCPEIKYLGFLVTAEGLSPDPDKIAPILELIPPNNIKKLRSFIGMCSWYRRFIPQFSSICAPLTRLLRKNEKWNWSFEQQDSFDKLKELLTSPPILARPDFTKIFQVQTDASGTGLGAVLSQQHEEGEKVVTYASRTLQQAETKYTVTEQECLGVVWAVRLFRPYLEGYHFIVITDHHSLKWLMSLKDPNSRLARWAMELQSHDFEIKHRKGADHHVPDALSRLEREGESDMEEIMAIGEEDLEGDEWYQRRIKAVLAKPEKYPDFQVRGNSLYCHRFNPLELILEDEENNTLNWKLVVPLSMRQYILAESHDRPDAGHLGIVKTYHRVYQQYYWPGMFQDVADYVRSCDVCQKIKPEQKKPVGLMSSHIVEEPWTVVSTDLMGPFPRSSQGFIYIVVFVDLFTKQIEATPLRRATAETVDDAFRKNVLYRWGAPEVVVCDNGSQFDSTIFRHLCDGYGIRIQFTPPYHPQANPTERYNRTFKGIIRSFVSEHQKDWDKFLPEFCWAMNTTINETTKFAPAFLNYGRHPKPPATLRQIEEEPLQITPGDPKKLANRFHKLKDIYDAVSRYMMESNQRQKRHYDLRRRPHAFKVGNLVVKKQHILSNKAAHFSAKLAPRYEGPYKIETFISENIVELTKEGVPHKTVRAHVSDLKKYEARSPLIK